MTGPRFARMICIVAALSAAISPAFAQERYRRDWSDHPGMPRQILDLTHDDRGFLWLASEEGVHRFDGQEVVAWGRDVLSTVVHGINRGPDDRMVVFMEGGPAYEITPEGLEKVVGPDAEPFDELRNADYAGDGSLWLCNDGDLFHRSADKWTRFVYPGIDGQNAFRVRGAPDGGAFLGTAEGSFVRVFADHTAEIWASGLQGRVMRIAVKDERTQAFALRFGPNHGIFIVESGRVRPVYRAPEIGRRWTGIVFRDETLWAVATNEVVRIEDGERVEVLGPEQGLETGGAAVVDHEKSLWLTSLRGTYQYTEPDVVLWTEQFGTRAIHRIGSTIYLGRWDGPQRRQEDGDWERFSPDDFHIFDWGGISPWGHLWYVGVQFANTPGAKSALLEYRNGHWKHHLTREHGVFSGSYATDDSGAFWLTFFNSLWRVTSDGAAPQPIATLAMERAEIRGLSVRDNRVRMAFRYGPYCEGTLNADSSALAGEWDCETVEHAGELNDMEMVDGTPWLGTRDRGVIRKTKNGWEDVIGQRELGASTIRGISHSPSGGIWVITYLGRVRIELDEEGVHVVERLGPWIGVPNWMTFNTLEEPDGTLWLSGMPSAIEIPPHARQRPTAPPRVFVTGFSADGRILSSDMPQVLPATTSRIELRWAAPAYRDPGSLRYQVRADSSGDWVPARETSFRFVDLAPGDYHIEVRASLDGDNWSEAPADVRFEIRSPLWQRRTFWAAVLALGAIGVLLVQWQRTRQQVRFERQRTDIAMNLHDELGAGLGSIGLLTDLVADEKMDPVEGREVATRVGEISRGLSRSLSDIVWTLRPSSVDLPGFAQFLRQRAADLLSAGDTTVEFEFPDPVPPIQLQLEVRRQIHAIASEALHNAAKHAQATKVRVSLDRDRDDWILRVADDGVGFDEYGGSAGLGLESMRKRAKAIGANLSIQTGMASGACLQLRFAPRVEDRR